MQFDISRDYLDGIMLQQPTNREGKNEIRAAGQLHFLPSSPDGTMHTAVVGFALSIGDNEAQPFARGGWRFLFTTDASFDPTKDTENPFFGSLLALGAGKIMAQLNNLCMHANLPLIPFQPGQMVMNKPSQQQQQQK
ncbi:MAG: hypothetical protein H0W83_03685 [Planctomycetes bacterium]|nr:hypothetical protein [Planctomycetota bacterium]